MPSPRDEAPLSRSPVFRQLNGAGRFARFGKEDAFLPLMVVAFVALGANLIGYHPAYAYVAFAASMAASWLVRVRYPNGGLVGLLRFLIEPRHLSAHAQDTGQRPYPAATPRETRHACHRE